jgi:hypothetical protein
MISQNVTFKNPCKVSSLGREMRTGNSPKTKRNSPVESRRGSKMDRYATKMIDLRVHVKLPFILPHQQNHTAKLNANANPFHRDLMSATEKWVHDLISAMAHEAGNILWSRDLIGKNSELYDNSGISLYGKSYIVYSVTKPENASLHSDPSCSFWWAELDVLRASTNNTSWLNELLSAIRRAFYKVGIVNLDFRMISKSRGGVLYITINVNVPWQTVIRHAGLGDKYGA